MRTQGSYTERLFRLVCLGFSGLLLVLTLFWQIRLARTQARIEALETAIAAAQDESARLTIREESFVTLETLERVALQELGLRHPAEGQIVVLDKLG